MKAYYINGGLGRVLCAIPALQKLQEKEECLVVYDSWSDAYLGAGLKCIEASSLFLAEATKDSDIITPEPYHLKDVRNGKLNLVQGFNKIINNSTKQLKPYVPLDKRNIADWDNKIPKSKRVVIQPYGSGGKIDSRSMTTEQVQQVINLVNSLGMVPVLIGTEDLSGYDNAFVTYDTTIADFMSIISLADYFIGCDSAGMHIARGLDIPGTIILGGTSGSKWYPDWFKEQKSDIKTTQNIRLFQSERDMDYYNSRMNLMNYDIDIISLGDDLKGITNDSTTNLGS